MTDIINPMSRGSVACSRYLKWIHEETLGSYGAWVPSRQRIDPGDSATSTKTNSFTSSLTKALRLLGSRTLTFPAKRP